uniref:Uncharacterized protein n=1 Tax=Arundo donax TaxID=35708 RepID=A0A0A9CUY1_ARUDO
MDIKAAIGCTLQVGHQCAGDGVIGREEPWIDAGATFGLGEETLRGGQGKREREDRA